MRLLHWCHPIQRQAPLDCFLQRLEWVIRVAANLADGDHCPHRSVSDLSTAEDVCSLSAKRIGIDLGYACPLAWL